MTYAEQDEDLEDRIDCLQKSVARLRNDIIAILDERFDELVLSILKEEQARRRERCW
jgi:hypothetical protein